MKNQTRKTFKLRQTTVAVMMATAALSAQQVNAGPGWGDAVDQFGTGFRIQTYFANSPSGVRQTAVPESTVGQNTGTALRKFVDPLPLPDLFGPVTMANGTQRTIPTAVATKWVNPEGITTGDEYYEIAIVEYTMRWHSDLPKETTMRGYVQIDHSATNGGAPLAGSGAIPLTYPGSVGVAGDAGYKPIMIQATDGNGKLLFNVDGTKTMVQALAVKKPEFLGPVVIATRDVPIRYKFRNLLPVGRAQGADGNHLIPSAAAVVTQRNGDLFLPVDSSLMGAGYGPDGTTMYTQNRAVIHLHGGDTPWISDGTPHQWIAPAGENDAATPGSLAAAAAVVTTAAAAADAAAAAAAAPGDAVLAAAATAAADAAAAAVVTARGSVLDPAYLPQFVRGVNAVNVPDMNDPGDGAMTYYFPNGQSARLLWYHDHTAGLTRVNVIAGEAAGYLLMDDIEKSLMANDGILSPTGGEQDAIRLNTLLPAVLPPMSRTIPLVLQDRTFVPNDIALQDAKWNTSAWGQPGDSWFPHVYETVQDPAQQNNWNSVGRWHYGPWFWPVFPALYELPDGSYGNATTTPEAWADTAAVNGVAYPYLNVDPTTYRFRMLNATNDRLLTVNLFVADETIPALADGRTNTEVPMIPATAPAIACVNGETRPATSWFDGLADQPYGGLCTPDTWQFDNRSGGLPNPAAVGPTMYQIASEGGFLPQLATYEPSPITYLFDKGRATVLNVDTKSLFLGPAERADVVVDFSQYAGKTLILYNDSFAPVPAGDPRNDYFTGDGDQSSSGGAEDTLVGFGPNTRTMMQFRVAATNNGVAPTAADAFDPTLLAATLPTAYGLSQERPVVGQGGYNAAFGEAWNDVVNQAYSSIYVGSLKEPQFVFTPGTPSNGGFNSVTVTNGGTGYITAPTVVFADDTLGVTATGATANATLKITAINVNQTGNNYTTAPVVTIVANAGGGSGATAEAKLGVNSVNLTTGTGLVYTSRPTVTFSTAPGVVRATGTAIMSNEAAGTGTVVGVTVNTPGSGYAARPTVTFSGGGRAANSQVKGTANAGVHEVRLIAPDPTNPDTAGGGGYGDLSQLLINFVGGGGTGAAATATGRVFDVTLVSPGTGYTDATTVSFTPVNGGAGAEAWVDTNALNPVTLGNIQGRMLVKTKAVHELFDATFGRLNSIGAVELPFTSALTQTTIPLAYIDEATEFVADGETQIWKFTHNGVDTHPVHFHLLNVQLINRVGWDGFVSPPEPNELGWKETVKMHPLEDVIVAVRSKRTPLGGFGLPNSVRALDPTQPLDSPFGFTQVDANTGNPRTVVNSLRNFSWEYVWHCHILGHEENDFMRPFIFNGMEVVPGAPVLNAPVVTPGVGTAVVDMTWIDATPRADAMTAEQRSDRSAEIGFRVERRANGGVWTPLGKTWDVAVGADTANNVAITRALNSLANTTMFSDATAVAPAAPVTPAVNTVAGSNITASSVTLSWTAVPDAASYNVIRNDAVNGDVTVATGLTSTSFADSGLTDNTAYTYTVNAVGGVNNYDYQVVAVTSAGEMASNAVAVAVGSAATTVLVGATNVTTLPLTVLNPVTDLAAEMLTTASVRLTWTDASIGETGYRIQSCQMSAGPTTTICGAAGPWTTVTTGIAPAGALTSVSQGVLSVTLSGTLAQSHYSYRVAPLDSATAAPVVNIGPDSNQDNVNNRVVPADWLTAPTAASNPGAVTLSWIDGVNAAIHTNNNSGVRIQVRRFNPTTGAAIGGWRTVTVIPAPQGDTVVRAIPRSQINQALGLASTAVGNTVAFRMRPINARGTAGNDTPASNTVVVQ